MTLPGVGRKTANVVRSVAFGLPGLPVDTHVGRLARRLGLTDADRPGEGRGASSTPWSRRTSGAALSLRLILHGRQVCKARSPRCGECVLADICPSAGLPVRLARGVSAPRAISARRDRWPDGRDRLRRAGHDPSWCRRHVGRVGQMLAR